MLRAALHAGGLTLALLAIGPLAHAGSLRCGTAIVSEQADMHEVLAKCGPPTRQASQGPAPRPNAYVPWNAAQISIWVYGPDNGAYQYLRFVDERLVEIEMRREPPGERLFPWE